MHFLRPAGLSELQNVINLKIREIINLKHSVSVCGNEKVSLISKPENNE